MSESVDNFLWQKNKLMSLFHGSVWLLTMNVVITLSIESSLSYRLVDVPLL